MARAPRGFRNVSTTHQTAYATIDGNVHVRHIGGRLWEILQRGKAAQYEKSKRAALDRAFDLSTSGKGKR